MGWRTFFSAGKKFRATNKVARLLAAPMLSSFGHCGESGRKGSFTASVSKRTRNWALSQPERLNARDKLTLRFPEGPQTIHQVAGHTRQIEKIRSSAWHREPAAHVYACESNARARAVFRWAAQFA